MIIRREGREFVVITQPDHAALARQVMEHCIALRQHPRAASILLAIGEHDNGWTEPDADPLVNPDSGEPLDFIHAPAAVRQGVWPRGVARLAKDPWAAALVAHHAWAVYDRYHDDEEWKPFFSQMKVLRDSLVSQAGAPLADLVADYRFVRLGDLISLVFCAGWKDTQRYETWTVSRDADVVSVAPQPFEGPRISVTITGKQLPLVPYRTDQDLRTALAEAPAVALRGEVVGREA